MSLKRSSRLLASAAVTAGLVFAGLSATAPAAEAATASATAQYTCGNPLLASLPAPLNTLGTFKVPATFTLENLPSVLTANVPIPAGTPISGIFNFPTTGGLSGILTGVSIAVQSLLGPTPLGAVSTAFSNGVATLNGQLGSFTPTSGLPLPIPTSFDASILTNNPLFSLLGVKCTLDPGSTVITGGGGAGGSGGGVFTVVKQTSKIKAKAAKKSIHAGSKATVKVKVKTSAGQKGVGSISAKAKGQGVKSVTLKNGKARLVFKNLKIGVNKIKIKFLGNSYTDGSKKKVKVRVSR